MEELKVRRVKSPEFKISIPKQCIEFRSILTVKGEKKRSCYGLRKLKGFHFQILFIILSTNCIFDSGSYRGDQEYTRELVEIDWPLEKEVLCFYPLLEQGIRRSPRD